MATVTKVFRVVYDEGSDASNPVTVEQTGQMQAIEIRQDSDRIYMRLEHAEAVHAALTNLIQEIRS